MSLFQFVIAAAVVFGAFIPARAGEAKAKAAGVRYSSDFECGLNHRVRAVGGKGTANDPACFTIQFPPGRQQGGYFLFRLDGVAGKAVRIDIHTDRARNWKTLNPVFAPIDPGRDTGQALADPDLFACRPPPKLDTKKLPEGLGGSRMPLTGGRFQRWRYIARAGVNHDQNTFRIEHQFNKNQHAVLLAMKVPYTPKLCDALMWGLQKRWDKKAASPGPGNGNRPPAWAVVKVGDSKQGRPLWLVRIGRKNPHKPCILFYAREHADEHDSSWVAQGVIDFLLSSNPHARAIRRRFTVLVIPLLDPDGAAANVYKTHVIRSFDDGPETHVSLAWARWLARWVGRRANPPMGRPGGHRLDVVIDLHNVESSEGDQLFPYMYEVPPGGMRAKMSQAMHESVIAHLPGYHVKPACHHYGNFSTRLGGWLRLTFGTHLMFYEVNSQAPDRHLSLYQLKAVGPGILEGVAAFLYSPESLPLRQAIQHDRMARYARWKRYGWLKSVFAPGQTVFENEQDCHLLTEVERIYNEHPDVTHMSRFMHRLFARYGRNGPPPQLLITQDR